MAASMTIAEYISKFVFKTDTASVTNFKKQVKDLKDYVSKTLDVKVKISKFTISKRDLNSAIREAVSEAGGVRLSINSFSVNATELRKSVQQAFSSGVTLRVNATTQSSTPRGSAGGTAGRGNVDSATNILSRFGLRAIPAYATGVGVMGINQISEDIQSSKISLNTVTSGRGVDAFQWLKSQGNELGFDYRNQLPVFSSYLGASINKQGYEKSLQSFRDLTTYGITHGADRVSMERAMLAIGQMWSKGKVMGEELNQQLAEAKGFSGAKQLFAQAWQEKTGGKLEGQKAEAALIEAMKKGLVTSADIMPIVTRLMGEKAQGGLESIKNTTGFQHNRAINAWTNAVEVFGKGGFDEGMMRFFKFFADFLDKHTEHIKELGKNFLTLEKVFEKLVVVGESLFEFFYKLAPNLTMFLVLLAPLAKVMGGFGIALTGIALALNDLDVYINGGDSILGRFVSYMKDLTNMDMTSIAAGIGVIGIAITAAFSPLLGAVASLGVLVEMFKYTQGLKTDNSSSINKGELPSAKELREGFYTKARNKINSGEGITNAIASALLPIAAGGSAAFPSYFNWIASDVSTDWRPMEGAVAAGAFDRDKLERLKVAVGTGQMTPQQAYNYFDKTLSRNQNPNIFPAQGMSDLTLHLNGTFTNEVISINDMINQAIAGLPPKDGKIQSTGATN